MGKDDFLPYHLPPEIEAGNEKQKNANLKWQVMNSTYYQGNKVIRIMKNGMIG